jgi:hypothetical protein
LHSIAGDWTPLDRFWRPANLESDAAAPYIAATAPRDCYPVDGCAAAKWTWLHENVIGIQSHHVVVPTINDVFLVCEETDFVVVRCGGGAHSDLKTAARHLFE